MTQATGFIVDRKQLRETRFIDDSAALAPLGEGAVRLHIDKFALTSNNITYAAFGDAMKYWQFFPSGVEGWGRIPVWGFANVIESRCEGVAAGERFYGYFPMSTHLEVWPERVRESGFVDSAAHRQGLAVVYNQYTRCSTDPAYSAAHEAQQALLRPLFMTSFLIDDFLADEGFFDASAVILSSASSKTAYGTAFCLAQRKSGLKLIGLTSSANIAFTESLGCYDQVLSYDALPSLDASQRTVYVDFSGSAPVRLAVHTHFSEHLVYSCAVGGTHWEQRGSGKGLPGPAPVLFFAPARSQKRIADWGGTGLQQRTAQAWQAFMQPVTDPQQPWLQVVRGAGQAEVLSTYLALLDNKVPAREGHVLSL
jgi:hypothetical protein